MSTCRPVLLYYPGKNDETVFGHVAIGYDLTDSTGNTKKTTFKYLSYGMGEGLVREDSHPIYEESETEIYGAPIKILLPPSSIEAVKDAAKKFSDLNRRNYHLLKANCANAVANFLKDIKFIPHDMQFSPPLRPQYLAKVVCDKRLKEIASERSSLLNANLKPLEHIESLIENDIDRLRALRQLEIINHKQKLWNILGGMKLKTDPKIEKIKVLEKIKTILNESNFSPDHDDLLKEIFAEAKNLDGQTKINFLQAMKLFPFQNLSIKDVEIKAQPASNSIRDDILLNDELSPQHKIGLLLLHNLSNVPEQNLDEINKIERLIKIFHDPEGDLNEGLELLIALANFSKVSFAQDCLRIFPYEELPDAEKKTSALLALQIQLDQLPKANRFTLFSKNVRNPLADLLPSQEVLLRKEPQEIYELHSRVSQKILQDLLKKPDPMLDKAYKNYLSATGEMGKPSAGITLKK